MRAKKDHAATLILRQSILDHLQSESNVRTVAQKLDKTPDAIQYHFRMMVKEGFIELCGYSKWAGRTTYAYKALCKIYSYHESVRAPVIEKVKEVTKPHARVFNMSQTHHYARMPHKQRSAWIGSTMGTMSY